MKVSDITIRDPYVLVHEGIYYLYGTRSHTTWSKADGFDVYYSRDLENWEGPVEIFHRPDGFWADENYWAPECYEKDGKFYLLTTFGTEGRKKGIHVLISNSPLGPFEYISQLTNPEEECIDGTLYTENGRTYLVYSKTLQDDPRGSMCALELSEDWSQAIGAPNLLFTANQAPWPQPVPFAEKEFGITGEAYFTDGPALLSLVDGRLAMLWSSWSQQGYGVGVAISANGKLLGPWEHQQETLIEDAGHGMIFKDLEGRLRYALHSPNTFFEEHPKFYQLITDGSLKLED